MVDIVGVLGESSTVTATTTTVYTVPTSKAAKVKFMFIGQLTSSAATLAIAVNGATIATVTPTASHFVWSSSAQLVASGASKPDGTTIANTVAPCPQDYYLSAGDVVSYTISTNAFASLSFQVVGVEIDLT